MEISQKQFELEAWCQLPTNRKWPMVDRMMTSSIRHVTLKGQGRCPNIFKAHYFENRLR